MSKYRNIPTTVDNIKFDSKREAAEYANLKLLLNLGKISELVLQERFPLKVNGELICTYVADFSYKLGSSKIVADAKGVKTPAYKIKKKLMRAIYGVEIQEV